MTMKIKTMIQVPVVAAMVAVDIVEAAVEEAVEVIVLAIGTDSERKANFKAG
jgi:hypothetical protein